MILLIHVIYRFNLKLYLFYFIGNTLCLGRNLTGPNIFFVQDKYPARLFFSNFLIVNLTRKMFTNIFHICIQIDTVSVLLGYGICRRFRDCVTISMQLKKKTC